MHRRPGGGSGNIAGTALVGYGRAAAKQEAKRMNVTWDSIVKVSTAVAVPDVARGV